MNTFQPIPDGSDLFEESSSQTHKTQSETDPMGLLIDTLAKVEGARDAQSKKKQ